MSLQSTDPVVSRAKFDREIAEYRAVSDEYRKRGWFLAHAEFPKALVVLAAPQVKPPAVVTGVAFDYTNYDAAPPSVMLVNAFTGVPYKASELPTALNRALPNQELSLPGMPEGQKLMVGAAQAYMQALGQDDVPFLCLPGVREYHEHPAHTGDAWDLHRASGAGRLVRLLDVIYRYGVEPINGWGVQLVPQVRFNFGPPPP
jgi:hypothetical protein